MATASAERCASHSRAGLPSDVLYKRGDNRRHASAVKDRKIHEMSALLAEAVQVCSILPPSESGDSLTSRIALVVPGIEAAMKGERIACGTQRRLRNGA